MLEIKAVGSRNELQICFDIRRQVFVVEQKVSAQEEYDELDPLCQHFLALLEDQPVGTARLYVTQESQGKAQRVAVLKNFRRHGVGRALMLALEQQARHLGCFHMTLSAQVAAIPFYQTLGYVACSDEYIEANIAHRKMQKSLLV
jgi:predicted GNAT family N-acyltransferase